MNGDHNLRQAVRQLVRDWDEYLHFPEGDRWKLEGVNDPKSFFDQLPAIFPHGQTLFVEGLEIIESARALFRDFPPDYSKRIMSDTLSPAPESFHVKFTPDLADRLCHLISSHGRESICRHFKGYSNREVLFTFHEAFEADLYVTSSISEPTIRRFATSLHCGVELVVPPTNSRKMFVGLDRALNPPWWKRLQTAFRTEREP